MKMISLEKIAIFKKYNGDLDGRTRMADAQEKALVSDDDWRQIERMIQDLYLVETGLASQNYRAKVDAKLAEACSDATAVDAIKTLAREHHKLHP